MCNKCEQLINCPSGEKRVVEVDRVVNGHGDVGIISMVLDRDYAGVNAFITTEVFMDETYANMPIDISYCPFCGEKLV